MLSGDPLHILVVEDDRADQKLIHRMLKRSMGVVQVQLAENIEGAKRMLEDRAFDCALVDLVLPDGDGFSLFDEDDPSSDTPMIILTNQDDELQAERAMRCGAQDYLIKGEFNPKQLNRSIRYAIERSRMVLRLNKVTTELHTSMLDLKEANVRLEKLATIDKLTGVANRRVFDQRLGLLIEEAWRGRAFSLVLVDIDHFKVFNDTYGHQVGDRVLTDVAVWLQRAAREVDCVARYGGEEFAILLVDVEQDSAVNAAQRFCDGLPRHIDAPSKVTASFGVASFKGRIKTGAALVRAADEALYRAKASGRNCVRAHLTHTKNGLCHS